MSLQRYVLRSKPKNEWPLRCEVHARSFEVFNHQIQVQPVRPRSNKVNPYCSGHIFLHINLPAVVFSPFRGLPHPYALAIWGSDPHFVPEELNHALHCRLEEIQKTCGENLDRSKAKRSRSLAVPLQVMKRSSTPTSLAVNGCEFY